MFMKDLYNTDENDYENLLVKYGNYYFQQVFLGGKLSQISCTNSEFSSTKTSYEMNDHLEISFGASASGWGASASASGAYASDQGMNVDNQNMFANSTSTSSIIVEGGCPGSFGPNEDSSLQSSWGSWAGTVDLRPVPVSYKLKPLIDLINGQWKNKFSQEVRTSWINAEKNYYSRLKLQAMLGLRNINNEYTLFVTPNWSVTKVGPYGFSIEGEYAKTKAIPFTEKIELPLTKNSVMERLSQFSGGNTYTFKFISKDIDLGPIKKLTIHDASDMNIPVTSFNPLSDLFAANIKVLDELNSAIIPFEFQYTHCSNTNPHACTLEPKTPYPDAISINFKISYNRPVPQSDSSSSTLSTHSGESLVTAPIGEPSLGGSSGAGIISIDPWFNTLVKIQLNGVDGYNIQYINIQTFPTDPNAPAKKNNLVSGK